MQLNVQARPFKLTPALEASVAHNLSAVESRFGDRIRKVTVRMDDINGDKGGIDKRCRIVIDAQPRHTVVAQALTEDMYQSISVAARRAETALTRSLQRSRRSAARLNFEMPEDDAA